jgi:hypothetical protein
MAGEIGVDAANRDGARLFLRCAGSLEQGDANSRQTVGLDHRHGNFLSLECPREGRILLAPTMLSKQRQQGKRGNILLAMRGRGFQAPEFPFQENPPRAGWRYG